MTELRPWERGDHEARWNGYFINPDATVLRNLLGVEDALVLADAENDLVEYRIAELRELPGLVRRSFDLLHLQALHRQLFQDVYEWAGELRTVGLAKGGGESFVPPASIWMPVDHVAQRVRESDYLRSMTTDELVLEVAYLYDYLNYAHPFREGNGRTQREFFSQLLAKSGRSLDWRLIGMGELHGACHTARNDGDLELLVRVIHAVLVDRAEN
ncbi:Fic family protein [Leucobacter sp. CSA2]|uniref:protein adenylyltransferase n=1 Tax=Leucobacter edaphi TaxID=2796472 RepID=A0A934UXP4_9MICO|nr:Fic family protein [Leucobacter edaphi]MBK0421836.1 Fic family protein [Leucobacter edaphi]